MLIIYPFYKTMSDPIKFAPEVDPYVGVDNLDLYGEDEDSSYDSILREETEFDGILGVQKHLDYLMQLGYKSPLELGKLGYPVDMSRRKYPLSGSFGEYWEWEIIPDFDSDCLVFQLWKNNPYD